MSDNYRIIKTNSYTDLDGSSGPLVELFTDKDQLYALTTQSAWMLPIRPQTLQTNESSIYVGTGDVLSVPPRRLATPDFAYGGTQHKQSVVSTEFGTV